MKNRIFVLGSVVLAAIIFVSLSFFSNSQNSERAEKVITDKTSLIRSHSPSFGNTLARVVVVEWFDPQCETCRAMYPILERIISEYKDRVHFVLRYAPFHQGSDIVISALEEAREFGKFDKALSLLFEKQPEWADHQSPRLELVATYLQKLGIPKDRLNSEYLLKKHEQKIRMDDEDGQKLGVNQTPTFFVNGEMIFELDETALRDKINQALKQAR